MYVSGMMQPGLYVDVRSNRLIDCPFAIGVSFAAAACRRSKLTADCNGGVSECKAQRNHRLAARKAASYGGYPRHRVESRVSHQSAHRIVGVMMSIGPLRPPLSRNVTAHRGARRPRRTQDSRVHNASVARSSVRSAE